jgi:spermidine/putrescine transport system permease protein
MTSDRLTRVFVYAFIVLFFAYLFGPLLIMGFSAFNSSTFPRATPWECFTTEWFVKLSEDQRLLEGLWHSIGIGFAVVCVSVPIGMAGAMLLTQVHRKIRPIFYTIIISPILVPGVVLGISTLIFWDRLGTMFDASYNSIFYDGTFLTVIGQSTFISAYCMLVFIARLQRFDPALEEAALDLGATNFQTFYKILLPFMMPAVFSAAVLAFLASFENYNTTVFTIVSESTLTTVLASKVRYGIDPSISALAVIIVALTLVGAIVFETMKRRETRLAEARKREGLPPQSRADRASRIADPAHIMMALVVIAGLGFLYLVAFFDTAACKTHVLEEKRRIQEQQRIPETQYQGVFGRGATEGLVPGTEQEAPAGEEGAPTEEGEPSYRGIFDPNVLKDQSGTGEDGGETESPAPEDGNGGAGGGVFDPNILRQQSGTGED